MASIERTHDGRVAHVVLDRRPLNVIDLEYASRLFETIERVRAEAGVAVIVLEARGAAFSAGVDVRDHLPDRGAEMLRRFHRVCRMLLEAEAPVIAVVQGAALGGGCELTLACDLVVASETAVFGQPEIKLGVFPPFAAVALPRMIAPHLASEMLLTGRTWSAREAQAAGLVNRVAAPDALASVAGDVVDALLALSPATLRLAKQAMALARHRPAASEIEEAERFYVDRLMQTRDAIEGLQAFMEKRAPRWTGA
jgi:cyclohexa-1,5-dienecarbonyl-CoA hydratase